MSNTPVNLNKVRKARARAAAKARADINAVTYGRSRAEKAQAAQETSRAARLLDGKVLETPLYGAADGTKKT